VIGSDWGHILISKSFAKFSEGAYLSGKILASDVLGIIFTDWELGINIVCDIIKM